MAASRKRGVVAIRRPTFTASPAAARSGAWYKLDTSGTATEHDDAGASRVMLIDESAALNFFGKAKPIAKTIRADIKYENVNEDRPLSAYVACAQDSDPWSEVTFEIRCDRRVEAFIPAVRAAIGEVNRSISLEFRKLRDAR
jgi:hypothetical protein